MNGLHVDQIRELAKHRSDTASADGFGYFAAASNTHFRTLDDGTRVFYPHGAFGRRGYVVASVVMEERLARRMKAGQRISVAACVVFALAYVSLNLEPSPLCLAGVIAGVSAMGWVAAELAFRSLTRRMKRVRIPNSPLGQWRKMGQTMHPALLVFGGTVAITMSICGFLASVLYRNAAGIPLGVLMAIATVPYGVAVWTRWRPRLQARPGSTDSR